MTVRLTLSRTAWQAHVQATTEAYGPGLVPVVKGNGYGFGRTRLHALVAGLDARARVCVGSVHELFDVPAELSPVVLTPALAPPVDERATLTVGSLAHVHALRGWQGEVMVKLASSMRRYGATPGELPAVLAAIGAADLQMEAFALHLPLAGDDTSRLAEIEMWLAHVPGDVPLWVSHLTPRSFVELQEGHPARTFRIRIGTALWHGVPRADFLHLTADVLHTQHVHAGDLAGYFQSPVPHDGTLVAIGGGAAHGIAPLDGGASPFHFARRRLTLLERPHMHTSLVVVPRSEPCPQVGERVDVQRPLIATTIDELEWLP